jgi:hypothetical protein
LENLKVQTPWDTRHKWENNTESYWVFGLFPSSVILETMKYDVSETGPIYRQLRGNTPTHFRALERANLNHWTQQSRYLPTHLRMETDPVSETSCSLVFRIADDGKSPKKSSNSECYKPSSEHFRMYLGGIILKCILHNV